MFPRLLFTLASCCSMTIEFAAAEDDGLRSAAALAQKYLDAEGDERRELAEELTEFDNRIDSVLRVLQRKAYETVEAGYLPDESFTVPELVEKHPDDLLFFHIPKSYRPDMPTGLIIFLHGGGGDSGRNFPHYALRPLGDDEDDSECSALGHLFDAAGLVAVGPSAPWNRRSWYRWCLRESDEYLADVILEFKSRFNIDADRVFLLGHSMGGFGAFHHVQRQPDRFAAVIAHAGSWNLGYWPVIRGTKLCFINGVKDAEKRPDGDGWYRWHYTDVAYARETDRILTEQKLDYVYYEHSQGHNLSHGKPYISRFLKDSSELRRDPYFPQIAVATPLGYSHYHAAPVRHNRWLTMNKLTPGKIEFDELVTNDEEDLAFDDWRLEHRKMRREGSALEGELLADNVIEIATQHVAKFTVWLHPKMIDVARPVRIVVNGETRFEDRLAPSLATALDSYTRRRDWGMIYPMKVSLELHDE